MRIAVIGLGSMGKRRIRLIQKYNTDIEIIGVDINTTRRDTCSENYNIETYESLSDMFNRYKIFASFICTSPLTHQSIIKKCLEHGSHVFTELNLVADGYDENISLAKKNNLVLFLSSTFLYRKEIQAIKQSVLNSDCNLNYVYHVGQYLPDWHPWESYHEFFVHDKRTNGCRELFAIELPWLIDVFGDIVQVDAVKSKMSSLNIDYNDNYLVTIKHASGHKGILAVDIVSRRATRDLAVYGEKLHLNWNGLPTGLKIYDFELQQETKLDLYNNIDKLDLYSDFIVENAYYNEIVDFFNSIAHNAVPKYTFQKDKKILDMIDLIES